MCLVNFSRLIFFLTADDRVVKQFFFELKSLNVRKAVVYFVDPKPGLNSTVPKSSQFIVQMKPFFF